MIPGCCSTCAFGTCACPACEGSTRVELTVEEIDAMTDPKPKPARGLPPEDEDDEPEHSRGVYVFPPDDPSW